MLQRTTKIIPSKKPPPNVYKAYEAPYNYIEKVYSDLNSNSYLSYLNPDKFKIRLKIDKSIISLYDAEKVFPDIRNALLDFGFSIFDPDIPGKGSYWKIERFNDPEGREILISRYPGKNYLPDLMITINDPDRNLLDDLKILFDSIGIDPKINQIELAYDFYGNHQDLFWLQFIFLKHLHLAYARSYGEYPNKKDGSRTDYVNKVRKSSKANREYLKEDQFGKFLRSELVLNRLFIRKHSIVLPLDDLLNVIDVSKLVSLKGINKSSLYSSTLPKYRYRFQKYSRSLAPRIGSRIAHDYILSSLKLYGQIERLKSYYGRNYGRFLSEIDENKIFHSILMNQKIENWN